MLKKCDGRTNEQTNLCIELRFAQLITKVSRVCIYPLGGAAALPVWRVARCGTAPRGGPTRWCRQPARSCPAQGPSPAPATGRSSSCPAPSRTPPPCSPSAPPGHTAWPPRPARRCPSVGNTHTGHLGKFFRFYENSLLL